MENAQSPSPPPPTPIPTAPGPRASQLSSVFHNALQHTLKACTYNKFSLCFPTPATKNPEILRSVHAQITMMIEEKAGREFDEILQEREVIAGLNDLENLVRDAKSRKAEGGLPPSNAPHTLSPQTLYLAQLAPYLTKAESDLKTDLIALQGENEEIADVLLGQREEIERLVLGLEVAVQDLEETNAILGNSANGTDLRNDIHELQGEKITAAQ